MAALKTLVLSSSPTSPTQEPLAAAKTPFKRGHTRNKSTSSAMGGSHQDLSVIQPIVKDCKEVTPAERTVPSDLSLLLIAITEVASRLL